MNNKNAENSPHPERAAENNLISHPNFQMHMPNTENHPNADFPYHPNQTNPINFQPNQTFTPPPNFHMYMQNTGLHPNFPNHHQNPTNPNYFYPNQNFISPPNLQMNAQNNANHPNFPHYQNQTNPNNLGPNQYFGLPPNLGRPSNYLNHPNFVTPEPNSSTSDNSNLLTSEKVSDTATSSMQVHAQPSQPSNLHEENKGPSSANAGENCIENSSHQVGEQSMVNFNYGLFESSSSSSSDEISDLCLLLVACDGIDRVIDNMIYDFCIQRFEAIKQRHIDRSRRRRRR